MREMWEAAQQSLRKAQRKQKVYHDCRAKEASLMVGDRVFIHTPTLKSDPAHKLASPFKGPYRVIGVHDNGLDVVLVSNPRASSIRVALNRVRRCPEEVQVPGEQPASPAADQGSAPSSPGPPDGADQETNPDEKDGVDHLEGDGDVKGGVVWEKRLRPRKNSSAERKSGEM